MTAVALDLKQILIDSVATMIAAILLVAASHAHASVVFTFVIVCHNIPLKSQILPTRQ